MCPDCESKFSAKKIIIVLSIVVMGVFVIDQYSSDFSQADQSSPRSAIEVQH